MFKHRMIGMRLILLPGVVLASLAIACADEVQIPIEQIVEVVKEVPVDRSLKSSKR